MISKHKQSDSTLHYLSGSMLEASWPFAIGGGADSETASLRTGPISTNIQHAPDFV